ncbi:1-phosphatidylinositol-4 5-bisphosphate phosphodiesterase 1 [Fusarium subglutinans]|uniref:Phosphoinositide phospholipase C n=1 Tax=Gibberella subglutinans TaxID=42677 RepID=A0A8H5PTD7_GIBSU|nr:1-phosphatidylinositol-4 5-bisphosphate phosphodiesterase 1 [Fusarium subglutinans]KAF5602861.1 1-phosphatidylinositol-4 5-bisphosphate phosphodiesterase 1 [Fusarium subglutinans]
MDLMSLTARDLSNKCLEAFQICLTSQSPNPGLSNQHASHDERFEYRLADFNLWIDGIGALAPSKASLDARLSERPIDLSLVKGNLVILFQSLEDCLSLLQANESLEEVLLDIDSALESLVTLSLAIRRTGRRSRLHKADRLFKPEEHAGLRKHLEAIIVLRPGSGPGPKDDEFRTRMESLTSLQSHLVTANLKRRNRFIQAQLHSLRLRKRSAGFELTVSEVPVNNTALAPSPENSMGGINMPPSIPPTQTLNRPLPAPMSVTSASVPESVQLQMFTIAAGRCWNSTFDKITRQSGMSMTSLYGLFLGLDLQKLISAVRSGLSTRKMAKLLLSLKWLDAYEHETEEIDPTLKLSTCDHGRLPTITEQIRSEGEDKLGLDIGFADEHGDESAEAETDISQLTQHTTESVNDSAEERSYHRCLDCSTIIVLEHGDDPTLQCAKCQSKRIELVGSLLQMRPSQNTNNVKQIKPANDPDRKAHYAAVLDSLEPQHSIPTARESTSGFRRFTDRLFSRKKADDIEPQHSSGATENLIQYLGLKQKAVENQKAWKILISVYHRRLDSPTKTQSMFDDFIRNVQYQNSLPTLQPVSDPRSFLEVMVKFYLDPLKQLPPKDLTKPISNYFINSSHRTPSHTLSESRDAYDAIKEVLYFGHRSIDLDVWNGEKEQSRPGQNSKAISRFFGLTKGTGPIIPASPKSPASQSDHLSHPTEPIVTDGYARMIPCGFMEACQVIRKSAFVSSDLPVIINLEVHADAEQQEMMVKIMKEEWHGILVDEPLEGYDPRFRLPTLEDLRGRILVRLGAITSISVPNPDQSDNDLHGGGHHRLGRISIIQPLAELGVYLRREKFEGFTDMHTSSPGHLFSLQESKVQELISTSPTKLFRHNQDYFFRVYPSSARQGSSNLDPLRFWRYGIQMAGIARHHLDEGMMLNEAMFADESGWVLKPNGYRSLNMYNPADPKEAPRKGLELNIFAFKDQEFLTSTGREIKNLASFMIVSLHINDEEMPRVPKQELNTTENESGALGYNLNFFVTRAQATIIPKLCILR